MFVNLFGYFIFHMKQAGYITRNRIRDEKGLLREMEYTVYSSPKLNVSYGNNSIVENPTPENPILDFPTQIFIYALITLYQWQTAKSRIYCISGVYVLDLAVWR